MGSTKNVDMSATTDTIKVVDNPEDKAEKAKKKTASSKQRSRVYKAVRSKVDKSHSYDPFAAIEMIKKLSYSSFAGTIEAHIQVRAEGESFNITLPHSTGKTLRVAVVTDELLEKIAKNEIEFDVLLAQPKFMPKLAKLAKILGPKGLMPNPKSGTLTEAIDAKKAELEKGTVTIKGEKKAPLVHLIIGKTSMDTKDLLENLQVILKATRGKAVKMYLSATMSPSVRVALDA